MFTISVKNCPSCSSMTSLEDCNGKIQLKTCRCFFSDRFACAVIQYNQDFYSRTCISDFTRVRAEKFGICMEDQCLANFTFTAGKLILVIAFSLLSDGIFLPTHTARHGAWLLAGRFHSNLSWNFADPKFRCCLLQRYTGKLCT